MAKKSDKRIKKYGKFKKKKIVGPIIFFLLFTAVLCVGLFFGINFFTDYLLSTKMLSEYDDIDYLARMYEIGKSNGNINYDLMDADGHSYIIVDKNGKVLYSNGENTCSADSKMASFSVFAKNINVKL